MSKYDLYCQLILSDCITHMSTMPDDSVKLILTDPPYNISGHGQVLHFADRKSFNGVISDQWDIDFNPLSLRNHFERILAPQGNIIAFTASNLIGAYYDSFNDDFTTNVAVWIKSNPPPRIRKAGFLAAVDFLMFHWLRGKPHTWNFTTQKDMVNVFYHPLCQGNERLDHPCQKPVGLLKQLIELASLPGDIVFDPFMGVGSTGHAALELGRSFIGSDTNSYYFEQAEKRLRHVKSQPGLF